MAANEENCEMNQHAHTRGIIVASAEETHLCSDKQKLGDLPQMVVVRFDDTYLRRLPGILRFLQVIFSMVALVCLSSSGESTGGYLRLPLEWHLRVFVFTSVLGLLLSLLILVLQITRLAEMLPIQWYIFDCISYSVVTFLFLFASSLVASAVDFYQQLDGHVGQWTIEQLIVAVVLGYMCVFLYGATALMAWRYWRGSQQFDRRRFSTYSTHSSKQNCQPA